VYYRGAGATGLSFGAMNEMVKLGRIEIRKDIDRLKQSAAEPASVFLAVQARGKCRAVGRRWSCPTVITPEGASSTRSQREDVPCNHPMFRNSQS
jgi:hypothetical protein